MKSEVIIAGAGPTGLALANVLMQKGVQVAIFDSKGGPTQESRAMGVHARTLEFYAQLGIADEVVNLGIPATEVEVFVDGKQKKAFSMESLGRGSSAFPYMLTFPQDEHEKLLVKVFEDQGGKIHWNSSLDRFTQSETGVVAHFVSDNQEVEVQAQYLVGCDGASSRVRHQLDIGFGGGTSDGLFFVADAEIDVEHHNRIRAALGDSTFGLMMPVRSTGKQRLIGAVPTHMQNREHYEFKDVEPLLTKLLAKEIKSVSWFSTYRVHHRVADSFQVGRVFIAGDAGHIHSPVGGQGMNTGIGDAVNLGWKLSSVIKDHFNESILDSYDPERRAFAKALISTTDSAFQKITAPNSAVIRMFKLFLPFVIGRLTSNPLTKTKLFKTVSQIHISYPKSPLSMSSLGKIKAGQRLPWEPGGSNYFKGAGMNWTIHVIGSASYQVKAWAAKHGMHIQEFELTSALKKLGFKRGGYYLVRPDNHVVIAAKADEIVRELEAFESTFIIEEAK